MNIVIYAGDRKYYSVLQPLAEYLKSTKHSFLFYYTKNTQLLFPTHPEHKKFFEFDGQVREENYCECSTLGVTLPFKPDVLILARERWQPEQSIIQEFRDKWNCTVGCVEVSSHLTNNIENRLEMLSRNNHPQNKIDYFFEHSDWAKARRIDCLDDSYNDKIQVVGNTRNFKGKNLDKLREKYKIDSNKEQILFWGVINTTRDTAIRALKSVAEQTKETHQIFYKCYPGEPFNENFIKDFNPFIVKDVTVVYEEEDIYGLAELCNTHIAAASSVFNFAFVHNKKIVNLDSVCSATERMNDLETFTRETKNGVEDSAAFWMNIWNINTIQDFKNLIELDRLEKFKFTNREFINTVRQSTIDFDWECKFLSTPKKDVSRLVPYFDNFHLDTKAPERIINFLENAYLR